jgi:hypothetical protein
MSWKTPEGVEAVLGVVVVVVVELEDEPAGALEDEELDDPAEPVGAPVVGGVWSETGTTVQ